MKNKKILFLAAAMLLGAGSLASCGNGNKGGNSIKVWAAKDDQAFLGQVVEKFKAAYPDYANANIELGITEEPDVPTQLKTDLAASADVFHFAGDQLGELVASNYLYGIPSALTSNIGIEPAVLEAGKVGGNLVNLTQIFQYGSGSQLCLPLADVHCQNNLLTAALIL